MSEAISKLILMLFLFMTSIMAFSSRPPVRATSRPETKEFLHHSTSLVLHYQEAFCSSFHQSLLSSIRCDPRGITTTVLSSIAEGSPSDYDHDDPEDDDSSIFDILTTSLQRLELTPEQTVAVLARVRLSCKTMSTRQKNKILSIDSTLSWLEDPAQLGLSKESVRAMVIGYPPLVGMSLKTNIIPTITFLDKALNGDDASCARSEHEIQKIQNSSVLETFLCEMPSILEYNVEKRLLPRLEKVKHVLNVTSIDEDILRIIATKTDSRFEEWIANKRSDDNEQGKDATDWNTGELRRRPTSVEKRPRRHGEPLAYVIVSNLQSESNIGNIVRSASIFGCEECLVVGQKRYRMTGDHGARFDLPRRHVYTHADARDYLLQSDKDQDEGASNSRIRIYGVEIMANASPIMRYDHETGIMHFPFRREWKGAAFIFGNEGQGLSDKQREICDEFLFIPQTRGGSSMGGGSASMNVACAATVILQAYCTWAGYSDAPLEGEKFLAQSS